MNKRKLCTSRWIVPLFLIVATGAPLWGQPETTMPIQAPVIFGGDTLFFVSTRLGPYSPPERARAITGRLEKLSRDPLAPLDSITLSEGETATDLVAGNIVVLSVTDADAAAAGRTRRELAGELAQRIRSALAEAEKEADVQTVLLGLIFSALATAVLGFALFVFQKAFHRLYATLETWRGTRIRGLRIQRYEILPAERITAFFKLISRGVRVVLTLTLFYFYISLVFSFFPWTEGYAAALLDYLLLPLRAVGGAFLDYLPKFFFIAVILFVTRYLLKLIRFIFVEVQRERLVLPGFYPEWALPTYKIVRFLVIAFAVVVIFPYLPGSDQPAFRGISIFLGVLFSLGSASAVANAVAGVVLTYMRPFRVGDRVKIADTVGDVTEKTLLVTRVRTIKNVEVTIPNGMVLGSHIVNYCTSAKELGLILHTTVTIGYDAPWRKVHALLIAAAQKTAGILKEPAPFVLQTGLDDSYVRYELNAYTDQPNRMQSIYSELHQNIQDRFNEAGVEIMSPDYHAVRDGNKSTIPEEHLPKNYSAPGFRISPLSDLFGKKEK